MKKYLALRLRRLADRVDPPAPVPIYSFSPNEYTTASAAVGSFTWKVTS